MDNLPYRSGMTIEGQVIQPLLPTLMGTMEITLPELFQEDYYILSLKGLVIQTLTNRQ